MELGCLLNVCLPVKSSFTHRSPFSAVSWGLCRKDSGKTAHSPDSEGKMVFRMLIASLLVNIHLQNVYTQNRPFLNTWFLWLLHLLLGCHHWYGTIRFWRRTTHIWLADLCEGWHGCHWPAGPDGPGDRCEWAAWVSGQLGKRWDTLGCTMQSRQRHQAGPWGMEENRRVNKQTAVSLEKAAA